MKNHIFALIALVLIAFPAAAEEAAGPVVGQPAPAFTATDSNGGKVSLADYKGKTVVLEWSNNECPFVRKHYESNNMQGLQKQATQDGVVWLTVLSSAPGKQGHVDGAAANKLSAERGASPTAVLMDPSGDIGRLYQAKTTPHMFVINAEGVLVYVGAIDSKASTDKADIAQSTNYVMAALTALKDGKPVEPAVTTAYGCGVKYAE